MMPESEHRRSILYLHEIEQSLVQADIELYLREELASISPADVDIKKLANRAGKLFIYAATAVRYIRPIGNAVNPQARLTAILAVSTGSKRNLSAIDALYSAVLVATLEDEELEPEERDRIRIVLWTVICACEPVLIKTLSTLCGLDDKNTAMIALHPLQSVLHVSTQSEIVTTLHASFPDYMFTQERSGTFFCDISAHSQLLAEQCFKIMQGQLQFNICSIKSSFVSDHHIPELEERIRMNVSDDLFYACRFWADHLTRANPRASDILQHEFPVLLYKFLSQKLLFWMEVLNLKKCIATCAASLNKLNILLIQAGEGISHNLLELAYDALKFVANYAAYPISAYTPHIYLSALPFSSLSSSVRSLYWPRFKGLLIVSGTAMNKLEHTALGIWEHALPIKSVAFSADGHRIALGSGNGELCVQSAYDGTHTFQPFKAHKKPITCVRFSHDGMQIVSGSYGGSITVWSAQNGSLISGPYQGHNHHVIAVDFSPDGVHIAYGSADCAIGISVLYQSTTTMRRLTGHRGPVESISFSPDGGSIISGSYDKTARIWDLSSGTTTRVIQLERDISIWWRTVLLVQYLPNGAYLIASDRFGHTLQTWDASGCLYSGFNSVDRITSLAVSPNGDHIASGSESGEIRVWLRHGGELHDTFFIGHSGEIESIHFSNDGSRIVSASQDNTVRIWNVHGGAERKRNFRSGNNSTSIKFSPDRVHTAIYTDGRSEIHIWNAREARLVVSVSCPKKKIDFLQYSHDGTRILSVNTSGDIYVWSALTAQLVDGPYHFSNYDTQDYEHTAWSADGTRVAKTRGNRVELWDIQSDRLIAVYRVASELAPGPSVSRRYRSPSPPQRPIVIFSLKARKFLTCTAETIGLGDRVDRSHSGRTLSRLSEDSDEFSRTSGNSFGSPNIRLPEVSDANSPTPGSLILNSPTLGNSISGSDGNPTSDSPTSGSLRSGSPAPGSPKPGSPTSGSIRTSSTMTNDPSLRFPEFALAATTEGANVIEVWDSDSGECVAGPFGVGSTPLLAIDISPDATHIAYWSPVDYSRINWSSLLYLVDVSRRETLSIPFKELPRNTPGSSLRSMNFTPDGDCIACSVAGTCYIWNIRDQTVVTALTTIPDIMSFAYSTDGWCLATSQQAPQNSKDRTSSSRRQVCGLHTDDLRMPFTLRADGWVLDDQSQPLFWVPIDLRLGFPGRTAVIVADDGMICGVNYDDLVVGDSWSECYIGN